MVVSKANKITKETLKRRRDEEAYQDTLYTVVLLESVMARQQALDTVLRMLMAAAQQSAKSCQTRKRYKAVDELRQEATRVWQDAPNPETYKPNWIALEAQLSGHERIDLLRTTCEQMRKRCKKRESDKILKKFLEVIQHNRYDSLGLMPVLGEIQETLQANRNTLLNIANNLNERQIPALGLSHVAFGEF